MLSFLSARMTSLSIRTLIGQVFVDAHTKKGLSVIFNYLSPSTPVVASVIRPLVLRVARLWAP